MQFSLAEAIDLQLFVFKRKDFTLICICTKIFFSKENIYRKLFINDENFLFSKVQHKIAGTLCGAGKI